MNSTKIISLTLPARGTGSYLFESFGTSKGAVQVHKPVGATTTELFTMAYNNFCCKDVPGAGQMEAPLTASSLTWVDAAGSAPYEQYWYTDNSFTGSLFTASNAPASSVQLFGNAPAKYIRFQVTSKTGGVIDIAFSRTSG